MPAVYPTKLGNPSSRDRRHDARVHKISTIKQQRFTGGLASVAGVVSSSKYQETVSEASITKLIRDLR